MSRESWHDGWRREGNVVEVGNSLHCAGCGKDQGILTIAADNPIPFVASPLPSWPFEESDCPVCQTTDPYSEYNLSKLELGKLMKAVARKKREASSRSE